MSILINIFCICALSNDMALSHADQFYASGYYNEAITEYMRFIYFNPGHENLSYAFSQIGLSYRGLDEQEKAVQAFRHAISAAPDDSIRNEMELVLAVTFIGFGNYSAAEILLLQVELTSKIQQIKDRAVFLRGIACLYGFKWPDATYAFDTYFRQNPDPDMQTRVDSLFQEQEHFFYRSPENASILSAFVPGLGQIWANDWKNGVNAFALNGAIISWIVYKLLNGYYGDAMTIHYFLFRRYYIGNRVNAERICEEYNEKFNRKTAQHMIDLFLQE
jgi:tetratricopeptide (TPR) repeat protein